jgi:hypothetical protein
VSPRFLRLHFQSEARSLQGCNGLQALQVKGQLRGEGNVTSATSATSFHTEPPSNAGTQFCTSVFVFFLTPQYMIWKAALIPPISLCGLEP